MSNHLSHLLAKWYPNKDKHDWVLATIYDTDGPCYRKSGAMMLFSSQGDQLGMLSGGCLESDIGTNARKVMQTGQPLSLCYDGSDEDDLSFHLGIGCGGTVYIMLQPINIANDYLSLTQVYDALQQRVSGYYHQLIVDKSSTANLKSPHPFFQAESIENLAETASIIEKKTHKNINTKWLANPVLPEPHLLIVGGGIDARPLANMAQQLGWQVSLWDPRPANARKEYFSNVQNIIKGDANILSAFAIEKDVSAAVLMSHNIEIDAQALHALSQIKLQYLALLGPSHRKEQVIQVANINAASVPFKFSGPSGLDIGGTLPESIALSILSECHAVIFGKKASSLSNIF
jgi:xanthine dehydrogenase accessory factor